MRNKLKLGKDTRSLTNFIYSGHLSVPEVGRGATELGWTDRTAYEVLSVSYDLKKVVIQKYNAKRIDDNGMGGDQEYEYKELIGHPITIWWKWNAWRRIDVDGRYKKINIIWGVKEHYYDYSF